MVTTNPWTTRAFGFSRGFDHFDDRVGAWALPVAVHPLRELGVDVLRTPVFRSAEDVTDAALSQIEEWGDRGYFLVVHYMDVHGPHDILVEDASALGPGTEGAYAAAYDAAIRRVDRSLGRLFLGLPARATVIVTADHGEELDEGRDVALGVPPGTRHGHTVHEELLRIPLIVRAPGVSGRRISRTVDLTDVLPTLARRAGEPTPERVQGEPLVELTGGAPSADRIFVAEAVRFGIEQRAALRGSDKLIHWVGEGRNLYDLSEDAIEHVAIPPTDPATSETARQLEGALPAVGVGAVGPPTAVGDELRALLGRLGYTDSP